MGERPVVFEGANLGLVTAVTLLSLAVGWMLIGPSRSGLELARTEIQNHQRKLDSWSRARSQAAPISESERAEWEKRYRQLALFGTSDTDETAMMAWVASRLSAPSVKGLQIVRIDGPADDEGGEERMLRAQSPDGSEQWELRAVPLRVGFDARYGDVSTLLRRLELSPTPLFIEGLELRRKYPDVRVEFDLTLWSRQEVSS